MVGIAQLVSVPGCGPGGRGFESHYSPHTRKSAKIDINCAKSQKKQSYFVAKQCNKCYYRLRTKGYRQAVRHQILILAFVGSNPATPANDSLAQPVEHRTFNAMVRSSNLRWVTKRCLIQNCCIWYKLHTWNKTQKNLSKMTRGFVLMLFFDVA